MFKLEKLNPMLKLIFSLGMIIIVIISNSILINSLLLLIILGIELDSEKSLKKFKMIFVLILIVAVQILLINLLFRRSGYRLFSWGLINIYSGFLKTTILAVLRIATISFSAFQYGIHTDAMEIAKMMVKFRIPYRYAMLIPMITRFFPVIVSAYQSISESQSARGVPNDRVWEKIKNMPATFFPLIYRSLRIANDAALSVELRGFGRYETRTFVKELKFNENQNFKDKLCSHDLIN